MKKIYLIIFCCFLIFSTPLDLKIDINIFEDEEIFEKYNKYLKEVEREDFETNIGKNNVFLSSIDFDNNVINSHINDEFKFLEYSFKNTYTFSKEKLELLMKKNVSPNIVSVINENIKNSDINKLFNKGNKDLEKFNEFKRNLIDYANSKIIIKGLLDKGEFLNNDSIDEVYNSIIELDAD